MIISIENKGYKIDDTIRCFEICKDLMLLCACVGLIKTGLAEAPVPLGSQRVGGLHYFVFTIL